MNYKLFFLFISLSFLLPLGGGWEGSSFAQDLPFSHGTLRVRFLTENAARIQYIEAGYADTLPEWIYTKADLVKCRMNRKGGITTLQTKKMTVSVNTLLQTVSILNAHHDTVFTATNHQLVRVSGNDSARMANSPSFGGGRGEASTLSFTTPPSEFLYGLGQFQDGQTNLRGLSRRLTQVNTQISIPMLLSSRGYALLWNNYGMTEYNPADQSVALVKGQAEGATEVVNVTSTEGGRREVRRRNLYQATLDIPAEGDYSLLLDVGQTMARRHNLSIDGETVIDMQNTWLPPTTSAIVHLTAGQHQLQAELTSNDRPVLYYQPVDDTTVLRSPVAQAVDYTVFVGTADEAIAAFRHVSGDVPMLPKWALGYIHCRERYHSSDEILQTANRFRQEQIPLDVIVQDWQWWGKYGWNAMRFDEDHYPDPKALTDSLHAMNVRLMLSVWSKIDKNSELGKQMQADGHYIPGTDWIDFFDKDAAAAYWSNFSSRLVPLGIDAWWQDATEPENDDLLGRRVNRGRWPGELVRNVYPLLVNKTVFEGLRNYSSPLSVDESSRMAGIYSPPYREGFLSPDNGGTEGGVKTIEGGGSALSRPLILTRCGFPGIQRYGSAMWSGDVGNDWETLRRQITAGLGMQAAGMPWWTYDAGGFFRPNNQYSDPAYHERLLRWIQTSVYLPLMRVHGYMSNTEPWNYGEQTQRLITESIRERHRLLPYIYSEAAAVSLKGSTLMRPLVFDFPNDTQALRQKFEYMFGPSLLVNSITAPEVRTWNTYLPQTPGGWYDFHTGRHYEGGQTVTTDVSPSYIPVFVRAGSILLQNTGGSNHSPLGATGVFRGGTECGSDPTKGCKSPLATVDMEGAVIYPGTDATYTLYEDDGTTFAYEQGAYSTITFRWNDRRGTLTIDRRQGTYPGMPQERTFTVTLPDGTPRTIHYNGKKVVLSLR